MVGPRVCWVCLLAAGAQLAVGAGVHEVARPADDALGANAEPGQPGEVRWIPLDGDATKVTPRVEAACVVAGRAFYVLGGRTSGTTWDTSVLRFDGRMWTEVEGEDDWPRRAGHTAVLVGDWIYVFGGIKDNSKDGLVSFGRSTLRWEPVTASGGPTGTLWGHTAVLLEDCMYIFGGWDGQALSNDLHCYSLSSNSWAKVAAGGTIPSPRRLSAAAALHGSMYLFGGAGLEDERLNDLHQFDTKFETWEVVKALGGTPPSPRYRHTFVASGNSIYVCGGNGSSSTDVHRYNVHLNGADEWQLVAKVDDEQAREGHVAAFIGSSMYVFGGAEWLPMSLDDDGPDSVSVYPGLWALSVCAPGAGLSLGQTPHCETCAAGQYGATGDCLYCSFGQMAAAAGSAHCEVCPPGTTASRTGATKCEVCPAGTFPENHACEPCAAGNWSAAQSAQCEECEAGRYSGAGATECLECPAGSVSQNASSKCEECPAGTHNESGSDCVPCAAGFHAPAGSSECERCEPGRSSRVGAATCFSEVGIFVGAGVAGAALAVLLVAVGVVAFVWYGRRLAQSQEKRRLTLEMAVLSTPSAAKREQEEAEAGAEAPAWVPPHPAPPNW